LKQFVILSIISLTIFSGCSSHFERYTPSSEHEKASTSYKNVRIVEEGRSKIVLSTIYLNDVYPKYTDGKAHFLIAFYSKENNSTIYFNKSEEAKEGYTLLLNGQSAIDAKELDRDDLLRELMPINNSWNRYHYVRYELPSGKPVLVLENGHTEPVVITYQKAQE